MEVIREVTAVPRYRLAVGTMEASQTTLLSKTSSSACFPSTLLLNFSHRLMHEMSFSASVRRGNTHVPWSGTEIGHLGAYHWGVGRDACVHMRAYVYREMYVFLPSLLALFANQRENK